HRTGVRLERWEGDKPSATVILTYQTIHFPKSYFENQLYNDMTVAVLRSAFLKELREEMGKIYSISVAGSFTQFPDTLARTTIQFNCQAEDVELLIQTIQDRLEK